VYRIDYWKDEQNTHSEANWQQSLDEGRRVAKNAVASGISDRVEIRNEAGDLLWQFPRVCKVPHA
jgi:hypothetical protein